MRSLEYLAVQASNQLTAHGVIYPSVRRVYEESGVYSWDEEDYITVLVYDEQHLLNMCYDPDDFSINFGTISNLYSGDTTQVTSDRLPEMAEYMLKIIFDN